MTVSHPWKASNQSEGHLLQETRRPELRAALSFLEGIEQGTLDRDGLRAWFDEHLVRNQWMVRPWRVTEPVSGAVIEQGHVRWSIAPMGDHFEQLLQRARLKILASLRGLVVHTADERFVVAAIFAGRVQRVCQGRVTRWVPRPRADDALSDIVLSLFAADILDHRENYESTLCVCDLCGRVCFDAEAVDRTRCLEHGSHDVVSCRAPIMAC